MESVNKSWRRRAKCGGGDQVLEVLNKVQVAVVLVSFTLELFCNVVVALFDNSLKNPQRLEQSEDEDKSWSRYEAYLFSSRKRQQADG